MVVFGQGGSNRARWFCSVKNGCIRAKVVVLGQKCFYLGERDCIRAKEVVFVQRACI